MLSFIPQVCTRRAGTSSWEPPPVDTWLPDVFHLWQEKAIRAQQTSEPRWFSWLLLNKRDVWSYDAEEEEKKKRKQSMGLFFAPLNLEITLAEEPCHCGRRVGKCGRNWNGEWPGNEHRPFSILSFSKKDKTSLIPLKIVALKMWEEQQ